MNIGQPNITLIQWLSLLSFSENKVLNPLSNLMSTSKNQPMKGKIYRIKSRLLIRKYRSFLLLWNRFILLKNTGRTTGNIRQIRLTRHFLKSTKLRLPYTKMPFHNSKNPISSSQIQRIFYLNLINYKKKRIPLCKSILLQNLQWTSFIKYERTMEFIWVRRWRDSFLYSLLPLPCLFNHTFNCFINIENCTFSIYPSVPKINS